jgi:hypothetical protein
MLKRAQVVRGDESLTKGEKGKKTLLRKKARYKDSK